MGIALASLWDWGHVSVPCCTHALRSKTRCALPALPSVPPASFALLGHGSRSKVPPICGRAAMTSRATACGIGTTSAAHAARMSIRLLHHCHQLGYGNREYGTLRLRGGVPQSSRGLFDPAADAIHPLKVPTRRSARKKHDSCIPCYVAGLSMPGSGTVHIVGGTADEAATGCMR